MVKCPSDVFDASVTTVILGFKKNVIEQKTINLLELKDRKFEKFGELSYSDIKNNVEYGFTFNKIILLNNSETILGNICKFSLGIKSSDDTKFIKDKKENEECKKLLRGKDVQKFQKNYANKWIWYRPDLMMQKVGAGPRNKEIFEKGYKILIKDIASSIQATIDYDGYYVNDTLNVIYEIEKKYGEKVITALLNSILINKWFKVNFEAGLHIKINQLQNIPISYDEKKYELLNQLVTKILSLKSTNNDSIYYENKIDALVFHLYGLNEAEMNQVLDTFTSLDTINRTQIQNEYRNITNNKFRLEV